MRFRSIMGAFRVMLSSSTLHISFFVAILLMRRHQYDETIEDEFIDLLNKDLLDLAWIGHFTVAVLLSVSYVSRRIYHFIEYKRSGKKVSKDRGINITETVQLEVDEDDMPTLHKKRKTPEVFQEENEPPVDYHKTKTTRPAFIRRSSTLKRQGFAAAKGGKSDMLPDLGDEFGVKESPLKKHTPIDRLDVKDLPDAVADRLGDKQVSQPESPMPVAEENKTSLLVPEDQDKKLSKSPRGSSISKTKQMLKQKSEQVFKKLDSDLTKLKNLGKNKKQKSEMSVRFSDKPDGVSDGAPKPLNAFDRLRTRKIDGDDGPTQIRFSVAQNEEKMAKSSFKEPSEFDEVIEPSNSSSGYANYTLDGKDFQPQEPKTPGEPPSEFNEGGQRENPSVEDIDPEKTLAVDGIHTIHEESPRNSSAARVHEDDKSESSDGKATQSYKSGRAYSFFNKKLSLRSQKENSLSKSNTLQGSVKLHQTLRKGSIMGIKDHSPAEMEGLFDILSFSFIIISLITYKMIIFRAMSTMYYQLVPFKLYSELHPEVKMPRSFESHMKLIQIEFYALIFSVLGVCVFVGVRYWLPYRIDRFEAGAGYLEDAISRRQQFCSFVQGFTLLTGVTWYLYYNPESFVDQERHAKVFLALAILNSAQLFCFLFFQVISYRKYATLKLSIWLGVQAIIYAILPVCLSLFELSTGEQDSFSTYWVYINNIYSLNLLIKYAIKYDQSFYIIIRSSKDSLESEKQPTVVVEDAREVPFEESIFSLFLGVLQRDEFLQGTVSSFDEKLAWKKNSVLTNFEIAEVAGTALTTFICQLVAIVAIYIWDQQQDYVERETFASADVIAMRLVTCMILHFQLTPCVSVRLSQIKFVMLHGDQFRNQTLAFLVSFASCIIAVAVEVMSLQLVSKMPDVVDVIQNFIAFEVILQFSDAALTLYHKARFIDILSNPLVIRNFRKDKRIMSKREQMIRTATTYESQQTDNSMRTEDLEGEDYKGGETERGLITSPQDKKPVSLAMQEALEGGEQDRESPRGVEDKLDCDDDDGQQRIETLTDQNERGSLSQPTRPTVMLPIKQGIKFSQMHWQGKIMRLIYILMRWLYCFVYYYALPYAVIMFSYHPLINYYQIRAIEEDELFWSGEKYPLNAIVRPLSKDPQTLP